MDRFKLNHYQILGLLTYSIGAFAHNQIGNPIGMMVIFLGLLVFFISSSCNIGTIVSLLIIAIGYAFKVIHFIYGNEIILLGIIGFLVSAFFRYIYKTYRLDLILIYISITILLLGMYLKIVHLKYGMELIFIGCSAILVSYAFRFIKKTNKCFEDYNKMLLVVFWSLSTIFNVFHWAWGYVFSSIFTLTLWAWLITSMIRDFRTEN
ncbi:hypothetical protein MHTCC0001_09820 [Flavobacteriaceae bacterium MHTCC 0001]